MEKYAGCVRRMQFIYLLLIYQNSKISISIICSTNMTLMQPTKSFFIHTTVPNFVNCFKYWPKNQTSLHYIQSVNYISHSN